MSDNLRQDAFVVMRSLFKLIKERDELIDWIARIAADSKHGPAAQIIGIKIVLEEAGRTGGKS